MNIENKIEKAALLKCIRFFIVIGILITGINFFFDYKQKTIPKKSILLSSGDIVVRSKGIKCEIPIQKNSFLTCIEIFTNGHNRIFQKYFIDRSHIFEVVPIIEIGGDTQGFSKVFLKTN